MSVAHERGQFAEPPVGYQHLLRRLMILCPATGRAADTGFELSGVPATSGLQVLVDCMECGQDHEWRVEDSFLG